MGGGLWVSFTERFESVTLYSGSQKRFGGLWRQVGDKENSRRKQDSQGEASEDV